ncbi:hypothetical protein IFM46972_02620 [Aspergillus udagawae]|uniref:Uncharacterized protein n=1 Tax=Aspergillus udagawae TaxID=91492 RepID=A0A8H3NDE3_9EURO|nr:hypothetical protein IFM46972_02620 [Aspergillus udagawae]
MVSLQLPTLEKLTKQRSKYKHHGEVRARRWRPAIGSSRIQMNRHLLARRATLCPGDERTSQQVMSSQEQLEDTKKNLLECQRSRNIGNGNVLVGLPE